MNVLNLKCENNRLVALNPDTLFSGGQNFDQIHVDLGDDWNTFDVTAVFYQDETEVYHEPMIGGYAMIPEGVLNTDGILYIGIYGISGTMRRVSSVTRVLVHQGAFTLGKTPSGQDVFSWLQDMLGKKVDKEDGKALSECDFTADLKTKLEGLHNYDDTQIKKDLDKKVDKVEGKGLSECDFTSELRTKLNSLHNYDDTTLAGRVKKTEDGKVALPVKDGSYVFGTAGYSAKSDGKGGITWVQDPTALKNPFSVKFNFTDGSQTVYDGSNEKSIDLSDCNCEDINDLMAEYLEFLNTL